MADKKKILGMVVIGVITALLLTIIISLMFPSKPADTKVHVSLPDATTQEIPKAKLDVYEQDGNGSVATYEEYLAKLASQQNVSTANLDTAVMNQEHQQVTKRVTELITKETPSAKESTPSRTGGHSSSRPRSRDVSVESWAEKYDYLLEKLYGEQKALMQAKDSAIDAKPETIHSGDAPPASESSLNTSNGFITINIGQAVNTNNGVIKAATTTEQKVKAGDKVQLRLLDQATINNVVVERNTYVYAIAKLENNRLHLTVSSINLPTGSIPCNLVAYDTDGYKGLAYTTNENAKEVTREVSSAVQNTIGQLSSMVNRTVGNVIRSSSRIGSSAVNNKQQLITLPQDYQIQLK